MIRRLALLAAFTGVLLSCSGEQRDYLQIHKSAIVADMHSDTPLRMKRGFDIAARSNDGQMDLPRLVEGGTDLQVFACYVSTGTPKEECRPKVDELIDTLTAQIARNSDRIGICLTAAEAESLVAEGKVASFIGIENGVAIAGDLANLEHFYNRGVRYLTLTHTASSDWCISSADTAPAFGGLTDFGREVVHKMNELGMIIDISHASVEAVDEVLKLTTSPVIASHSCVHAICPHDRNLTDEQIKAVAANGGVIGINYFSGYISADYSRMMDSLFEAQEPLYDSLRELYKDNDSLWRLKKAELWDGIMAELDKIEVNVGHVVDHIDHIVRLVGADYVGLGSDFDGVFAMPKGLEDCTGVPLITKELMARGYSEDDIRKILGGNFMRVFRQVCDRRIS
ncbi:MAG: dipeptidase [Candidatus Zixiibacteriota bacterium]|nr:MAG: dipeptidase [candidate division Zixibacteria bacterium]